MEKHTKFGISRLFEKYRLFWFNFGFKLFSFFIHAIFSAELDFSNQKSNAFFISFFLNTHVHYYVGLFIRILCLLCTADSILMEYNAAVYFQLDSRSKLFLGTIHFPSRYWTFLKGNFPSIIYCNSKAGGSIFAIFGPSAMQDAT